MVRAKKKAIKKKVTKKKVTKKKVTKPLRQMDCRVGVRIKGRGKCDRYTDVMAVSIQDDCGKDLIKVTGKGTPMTVYDHLYGNDSWERRAEQGIGSICHPRMIGSRVRSWNNMRTITKEDLVGSHDEVVAPEIEIVTLLPRVTYHTTKKGGTSDLESGRVYILGRDVSKGDLVLVTGRSFGKMTLSDPSSRQEDGLDGSTGLESKHVEEIATAIGDLGLKGFRDATCFALGDALSKQNKARYEFLLSKKGSMAMLSERTGAWDTEEDVRYNWSWATWHWGSSETGPLEPGAIQVVDVIPIEKVVEKTPVLRGKVKEAEQTFNVRPAFREGTHIEGFIIKVMSGKIGIRWIIEKPGKTSLKFAT